MRNLEEAQIAIGYLRAQGLDVALADEHTLGAVPIGAFRLMASEDDFDEAERLLAEVRQDAMPERRCRSCRSPQLVRIGGSPIPVIGPLLDLLFPAPRAAATLRCRACGHTQPASDDGA